MDIERIIAKDTSYENGSNIALNYGMTAKVNNDSSSESESESEPDSSKHYDSDYDTLPDSSDNSSSDEDENEKELLCSKCGDEDFEGDACVIICGSF